MLGLGKALATLTRREFSPAFTACASLPLRTASPSSVASH
jgi:hypothetical protein